MAFVHPQSCECFKSELDIFAVPPTQTSIEHGQYVEYNPIAAIALGQPIEFNISGGGQDYLDLANTQLYVKAQILRQNGNPLADGDDVGPVNLFLHSLFSEVDISLNDTQITSSNNTYPYRAYLETLLSYGPDAKASQLSSSMYYKDTVGAMDEIAAVADDVPNKGLKARTLLTKGNRMVDMVGTIHSDLFFQDKYLLNNINLRVRLVRSKDAFCLMGAKDATFKVKIHECKLIVRKIRLSPSIFLAHAKALEMGNAKYPIRRAICKTFTVPRGNLDVNQENLFSGQLPTRIVIGCVDNNSFNGSFHKNPFNFKHFNLTQLKIYLDGQQQSLKPIEPNFATNKYILVYSTLFSGTGKLQKDEGIDITRTDYSNGYALYAFDLTPDLAEGGHFNLLRQGNVRLELKFGAALAETTNVIVYAEFENIIEIDKQRNIILDYKN